MITLSRRHQPTTTSHRPRESDIFELELARRPEPSTAEQVAGIRSPARYPVRAERLTPMLLLGSLPCMVSNRAARSGMSTAYSWAASAPITAPGNTARRLSVLVISIAAGRHGGGEARPVADQSASYMAVLLLEASPKCLAARWPHVAAQTFGA